LRADKEECILSEAEHIIKTECTIRECAKVFGVSKTTVHKDMSKKLKELSLTKYELVHKILKLNYDERTIRGGEATKAALLKRKKEKQTNTLKAVKN
jgi:putative DeoR family transcriptional regulator (stage III sporulation protein D)